MNYGEGRDGLYCVHVRQRFNEDRFNPALSIVMNTYTHLTLLIDSIPLKYNQEGEVRKVKVIKLKSTIKNKRRSWL